MVDSAEVRARFTAGEPVASIAARHGVTPRRIRQIVQDLRQPSVPRVPWRLMLATVAMIVRTYGPNYGREMLIEPVKAALHATFGGAYRFTRRSMATALRLVSSRAHQARRFWATFRTPRGHYLSLIHI